MSIKEIKNMSMRRLTFYIDQEAYDALSKKHKEQIENKEIQKDTSVSWRIRDLIDTWNES
jgi:hypothetical protein